ncbi:SHOCT domain-containing protein [Desulfosporosinus fructosivorans]
MMHGSGHIMRGFGHGFMANGQYGSIGLIFFACHLIFLLGIIVLAIVLIRRHGSKVRLMQKQNDPALLILRERYALGEIETEEFNQRNLDLSPNPSAVKS